MKDVFNLVLYTGIIILINLILFSYVLKLEREKCDCSDNGCVIILNTTQVF